ncbi:MAG: TRAP transporter permease [Deltaproteobacteria bacterium]|nr:TRAP transporter permease [Deltaproteobacteria bacterium]
MGSTPIQGDRTTGLAYMIKALVAIIGIGISSFHLYTGGFGVFDAFLQRTVHLMTLMSLAFLLFPTKKAWPQEKSALIDLPLALLCLAIGAYLVYHHDRLVTREWYWGPMTTLDVILGVATVLLSLESARRVVGPALPIIAVIFIGFALFGDRLPYPFTIRATPPLIFIDHMFLTTQAILGIPVGASATFVYLFILFGAFLEKTGASKFIIDFSMALVGKTTGGPAKVAIVASGLFGTVSGHSVANVYGTGMFTIPLMKRMGFRPDYAGAVEAASSAGGQIMPPIMGAAAFIMAETLGLPYIEVAKAALIPALLYYIALFTSVHLEALKSGLRGISRDEVPPLTKTLKEGAHFLIPLAVLIALLVQGFTPFYAAFICILALVAVSMMNRKSRLSLSDFKDALILGARNSIVIAVSCGCAGIVVGALDVTGVGIKFVSIVTGLSMGILPLALVMVMASCMILGMGVPTAPAYIVVAMIAAPSLTNFGIPPMAAHMFVFYSALLSAITPPVALAAYAGAAISGGGVMTTGIIASKLGFVKFLVPYMFAYSTALLWMGEPATILWTFFSAIVGTLALAISLEGYCFTDVGMLNRVVFALAGLLGLVPETVTDAFGLSLFAALFFLNYRKRAKSQKKSFAELVTRGVAL